MRTYIILKYLFFSIFFGVIFIFYLSLNSIHEIKKAHLAQAKNDTHLEIKHLRRTLAYYYPGNPWVNEAALKLFSMAQEAIKKNNPSLALHILLECRSSLLHLRSLYTPYKKLLITINQTTLTLMSNMPNALNDLKTIEGQTHFLSRLNHPPEPKLGWVIIALLSFVLFISTSILLLRGMCQKNFNMNCPKIILISCLVVISFIGMGVGLFNA